MTAMGQGGAAPPPADGGPAAAPGTAPGGAPAAQQPADPFGFSQHVNGAPEHLRPMLQTAFDQISPQLNQRLEQFAPVEPHLQRLAPLLQSDGQEPAPIEGLLSLYELFDQQATSNEPVDALLDWWEDVGEQFGYFDPDDGDQGDGEQAATDGAPDLNAIEDPGLRAVVGQLVEQNQQLTAQLGEFREGLQQTQQQTEMQQRAEQIRTDLQTRMRSAGIEGHDDLNSPNALDIMRLAVSYGEDPQAIEKAVGDYARMTGRTPAAPANPSLDGASALQAALSGSGITPSSGQTGPGPSLGRGNADTEPGPVRGWDEARSLAMQRLSEAGG